jgi:Ca2+-transporting ATPase
MTAGAVGVFQWELSNYEGQGAAPPSVLAEAQTMAVTTVIMFQIFYLQNSRSLRGSLWQIGVFSNPFVYIGVAVILAAQAAFIYLPPLQAVFGSAPLDWKDLLVATLVGSVIAPVIALEKWIARRLGRHATPVRPGASAE